VGAPAIYHQGMLSLRARCLIAPGTQSWVPSSVSHPEPSTLQHVDVHVVETLLQWYTMGTQGSCMPTITQRLSCDVACLGHTPA
jgi:hypothetical protein